MDSKDLKDFQEFFKMFDIRIDGDTTMSRWNLSKYKPYDENPHLQTAAMKAEVVPAYQLTIGIKQLERLVDILKSKGYFHDDAYQIKLREEELIMSNPTLKHYHDQYKTLLYMLNDRTYDSYD
jgi:hypothetical protein